MLRYAGVIDLKAGRVEARLQKCENPPARLTRRYPYDHPFAASLQGSDNIISFHTKRYSPSPLVIMGTGAGGEVTAAGVTVSPYAHTLH